MCKCHEYGFILNRPCGLTNCKFHIESDKYKKCLHQYIAEKGTEGIGEYEIGSLLNIQPKEIKTSVSRSIDDLRIQKMDSLLEKGNELEFVEGSEICVVCSKKCDNPIPVSEQSGLCYCSSRCKSLIPPKLILIMQRMGVDERTVLITAVRCLPGLSIAELLGLDCEEIEQFRKGKVKNLKLKQLRELFFNLFGVRITEVTVDSFEADIEYSPTEKSIEYDLPLNKAMTYCDSDLIRLGILIKCCG